MPNITADQIITQKHKRNFLQLGGARPNNPLTYAGQDAQYMAIQGVSLPESGGIDPIWVPNPYRIGQYTLVGRSIRMAEAMGAGESIVTYEPGNPLAASYREVVKVVDVWLRKNQQ